MLSEERGEQVPRGLGDLLACCLFINNAPLSPAVTPNPKPKHFLLRLAGKISFSVRASQPHTHTHTRVPKRKTSSQLRARPKSVRAKKLQSANRFFLIMPLPGGHGMQGKLFES